MSRIKTGAAHVAFSAPTRIAVRNFYAAALNAGGRPHGSPASHVEEGIGCFNAVVMDLDGNHVEVICREGSGSSAEPTGASRVIAYGDSVVEELNGSKNGKASCSDAVRSVAMTALTHPRDKQTVDLVRDVAPAESTKTSRSQSAPVSKITDVAATTIVGSTTNTIIGTMLGAAAGAAVAYAMCKSEESSARAESDFFRSVQVQAQRQRGTLDQGQVLGIASRTTYEEADRTSSVKSSSGGRAPKMIEAPPTNTYKSPTYTSVIDSAIRGQQSTEHVSASAVRANGPDGISAYEQPRSHFTEQRQHQTDIGSSRSVAGKKDRTIASGNTTSAASSRASRAQHKSSDKSLLLETDHSNLSRSKDSRSQARNLQPTTSRSKTSAKTSYPQKADSQKASTSTPPRPMTSSSTKDSASTVSRASEATEKRRTSESRSGNSSKDQTPKTAVDIDEQNTIMPSDSISCAPSPTSSKKNKSKTSKAATEVSKRSKASKAIDAGASKKAAASEAGSVSTVRPTKAKRESVISLPVRQTNEKSAGNVGGKRSVASYA